MLECLHSFCNKCLKKVVEEQGSGTKTLSFKCPTCEREVSLPEEGGVDALPKDLRKNYEVEVAQYDSKIQSEEQTGCDQCIDTSNGPAISFCVNCCEFLCEVCTKHHKTWRKTVSHELEQLKSKASEKANGISESRAVDIPHQPVRCQLHHDETLKFYCETCAVLICRDCIVLKHIGHEYERVEIVAEKQKTELSLIIKDTKSAIAKVDSMISQGGKVKQQVQARQKTIEEDIKTTFKVLHEALRKREEDLLGRIGEDGLGKQTALTIQGEELKIVRDELTGTCETVESAVKSYVPLEILSAKGPMIARLQQLLKSLERVSLEPCRSSTMLGLLDPSEFIQKINSFGTVGSSCPTKAEDSLYILRAIANAENNFTITCYDEHGKWPSGREKVEGVLSVMGSDYDLPLRATVTDGIDGTYSICYTPEVCGEYELKITVEGQPIKRSPFHLHVHQKRKYEECTKHCQSFSTSDGASDVAVDELGNVYAVINEQHYIQVFDKNGTVVRSIGTKGSIESDFNNPCGIAIQGDILYVTDRGNNCVHKVSTSGEFMLKFGAKGSEKGQLREPRSICLDRDGRIYTAEGDNNRISVFEPDGTFSHHITSSKSDGSNLCSPWGVAFDPSGNLHVTNYGSSDIVIFAPEGKYIKKYSCSVSKLAGIALDEEGHSFVAENYYSGSYGSLFIFNPYQQCIQTLKKFEYAKGVTIDKEGYFYVTSARNKTVYKY
jgi:tripartite motif-containing protein 2/3/tripartite motif-containing protein 71